MRHPILIATVLPIALLSLASCGDDDSPLRTTAAYCDDLQALDDGGGGPTDAFFAEHPDPTLEDWADGLPAVIETVQGDRDQFAAIEPSADLGDERAAMLDAVDTIIGSFRVSLAAAEDGDQAAFDAEEARNQDRNVPAMEAAMQALMASCEAES